MKKYQTTQLFEDGQPMLLMECCGCDGFPDDKPRRHCTLELGKENPEDHGLSHDHPPYWFLDLSYPPKDPARPHDRRSEGTFLNLDDLEILRDFIDGQIDAAKEAR